MSSVFLLFLVLAALCEETDKPNNALEYPYLHKWYKAVVVPPVT